MEIVRRVQARRRWRSILRTLDLEPAALELPVDAPGPRDFMVCGVPRSGTALLVAALWNPPDVVCVMEPWRAMREPPARLFSTLRAQIEGGVLREGRLDIAALESAGAVRWVGDGEQPAPVVMTGDWQLGVKLPAFWQYLDLLPDTRFLVCIRSPDEVVASFRNQGGTLREGLDYDVPFNRAVNDELRAATDDPALRRILLHERIASTLLRHLDRPNVHVVRYERWFDDRDAQLASIGGFLGADLSQSKVRIRPAESAPLPRDELELLRRHSATAALLGYEL